MKRLRCTSMYQKLKMKEKSGLLHFKAYRSVANEKMTPPQHYGQRDAHVPKGVATYSEPRWPFCRKNNYLL